jgi:hypothetical protein
MRRRWLVGLAVALLGLPTAVAWAQATETLTLRVNKDFGFQAGNRVQGTISMWAEGAGEDVVEVTFLIDGQVVGIDQEAPFRHQFHTGDYALGTHVLSAVALRADGVEIRAPEREVEFVTAEEGWRVGLQIGGPILGLVLLVSILGTLGPVLLGRRTPFRLGEYGLAGGAVCARCGLPFSRHSLAPNLVLGKLERCPHCGKWSIARQASRAQLEIAEARFDADAKQGALRPDDEADRLRREIEDSRYES